MSKSAFCHDTVRHDGKGIVRCLTCHSFFDIPNVVDDPFQSSQLALEYARLTGDVNIPCNFVLADLTGIVPTRTVVPLKNLISAIQCFRTLNAPFVTSRQEGSLPDPKILNRFLKEYGDTIMKWPKEELNEQFMFQVLLMFKNMIDTNFFDLYFKVLVPYVESCETEPSLERDDYDPRMPPAYQFLVESRRSTRIRQKYSKYCIAFDVLHVMIYCYVCSSDMDVVANLSFELLTRVCKGDFFGVETPYAKEVKRIVESNVSYKQNTDLYYVVRSIEKGETCEHFSTLLEKYAKLEKLVSDHFKSGDEFAFGQAFPSALFKSHVRYYGFLAALLHVSVNMKRNKTLPKGLYAIARQICTLFEELIEKIKNYKVDFWTMETLHLFLAQDTEFERKIREMGHVIISDNNMMEKN
ncbi:hypothetical protein AVEN_127064-1 [Araneus ventricosus]|uniref:Uncharacterized protein n=1 Tax=Araneus ventricosus TaxID=182803 RepID=A0A4Y2I1C9_ARAVE|nr:hypothetical protein AVEN_127064-1 [Araneus ventricosus]